MMRLVKWLLLVLFLAGGATALWLWLEDDGGGPAATGVGGAPPVGANGAAPADHHDLQDRQALERLIRSRLEKVDGGG